jgi:hypothetical protein
MHPRARYACSMPSVIARRQPDRLKRVERSLNGDRPIAGATFAGLRGGSDLTGTTGDRCALMKAEQQIYAPRHMPAPAPAGEPGQGAILPRNIR